MATPRTIPVAHMPLQRAVLLAGGSVLSLACAIASATEVLVVTDRQHPVNARPFIRVIELDAPTRIVDSEVAAHLPVDPEKATVIARQRLQAGGMTLQTRLAFAYRGVIEAWTLDITKIPAVVVDRRYVVYGETDVDRAVSLIERYRSAQP